jgi:hypothetical protein
MLRVWIKIVVYISYVKLLKLHKIIYTNILELLINLYWSCVTHLWQNSDKPPT